jgi:hypothetical protein
MENNRSKFESHGYLINGIAEKLEIQISQSGDAALMCRTKKARYIVLEQQTEWDGTSQENA